MIKIAVIVEVRLGNVNVSVRQERSFELRLERRRWTGGWAHVEAEVGPRTFPGYLVVGEARH